MRPNRLLYCFLTALTFVVGTGVTPCLAQYTFKSVNYIPPRLGGVFLLTGNEPGGINNAGLIAAAAYTQTCYGYGCFDPEWTGFWGDARGRRVTISALSAGPANGINNKNQIVGWNSYGSYVLTGDSLVTLYPCQLSNLVNCWNGAWGINDIGDVVGQYWDNIAYRYHGYLLRNGVYSEVAYPGAVQTLALGLNNTGQLVGAYTDANAKIHGFVLSASTYSSIDCPDSTWTNAYGINNSGNVVGSCDDARGIVHGFLLRNGIFDRIDVPTSGGTWALGINDNGQIVGYSTSVIAGLKLADGYLATPTQP